MPGLVLRGAELRFAQAAFQAWKQVRDRLRIVPYVRARAMAAACVVGASLPSPQFAVRLSHDGRRFQNRQIGGHRFDDLRRQGRVIKAIAETFRLAAQLIVVVAPIKAGRIDIRKAAGIPGTMILRRGFVCFRSRSSEIFSDAEVGLANEPRQP